MKCATQMTVKINFEFSFINIYADVLMAAESGVVVSHQFFIEFITA